MRRRVPAALSHALSLLVAGVLLAVLLGACGVEKEPAETAQTVGPADTPGDSVTARVAVVDLDGEPLAGMRPVATRTPNAFGEPVVMGAATDLKGSGYVLLPADIRLYVRAWDPDLTYFANNYFDIPAGKPGGETPLMRIVMVEGASLDVVLLDADGRPAANTNVGLMMFHPAKGAWWPGEADTDAGGAAHFASLPAGAYMLKLKALNVGRIDIPNVQMTPGGQTDLGEVILH